MNPTPNTFGGRLKAARERSGKTQAQLAIDVDAHPVTVAKWESGTLDNPSLKTVRALAVALDVTFGDLVPDCGDGLEGGAAA